MHPVVWSGGLWRTRERTDAQVVADLEEVRAAHPGEWEPDYLLGLLHLERGDPQAAEEALLAARRTAPDVAEVTAALERTRTVPRPRAPRALKGHGEPVNALAFSGDGRFGLSAGEDGKAHVWLWGPRGTASRAWAGWSEAGSSRRANIEPTGEQSRASRAADKPGRSRVCPGQ
ncbi:WD40 repeat domain-containing protein [Actinomadura opuntiae]|uniref:WD40 repeat domain-containing protein n=1 Tax=Actinomadura sp. OS1-43 TaxID=604315 RepID=UPI00255AEF5D|nr:WD40 repeat domain-containing protein [Actinomadura sp. OS1-43]MDL4817393.1 WD40 repeat domain-containing protein [Actinomadura sp. OS1-43]